MPIYLDHASTTPLAPEIAELIGQSLRLPWGNPASQHAAGRRAKAALEDAKDRIKAVCLGSSAQAYRQWQEWQLVMTSGGTEANNLALHGLTPAHNSIYVGATEHPSIVSPALQAPTLARRAQLIPIDPQTLTPNIDVLEGWLRTSSSSESPALVSVMVGNNETGLMADISKVSTVCRQYGAVLHCDAVQAFGKCNLTSVLQWADAITLSAHKVNGPVGIGALLFRSRLALAPMFYGGGQQLELRPGTESVSAAMAMAAAVERAEEFRGAGGAEQLAALRDSFESMLVSRLPWVRIHGQSLPRLPHISSVAFPGFDRQALLMKFDLAGLECSSGSACASGSSQPSHVLVAMNLPDDSIAGTIRFSFGRDNTPAEIEQAVEIIGRLSDRK